MRLPPSATAEEVQRDEALSVSVYNITGAEPIKEAAVAIATILAAVAADPDAEFTELEEKFVGLPQSLIHRWYLAQGQTVPELEGPPLRNDFLHEIRDYLFVDSS